MGYCPGEDLQLPHFDQDLRCLGFASWKKALLSLPGPLNQVGHCH
jgi:hypothetical protein